MLVIDEKYHYCVNLNAFKLLNSSVFAVPIDNCGYRPEIL
jgi:hypothetical protein